MKNNKFYGYFSASIAATIWGIFFLVAKITLLDIPVLNIISLRYILASIPFWLIIVLKREKLNTSTLKLGLILGLLLFISDFFQLTGINLTTLSASALLSQGLIIFTPLILLIIGGKVSKFDFSRAILAIIGIYLFVVKESVFSISLGNISILLFALFISIYFIVNENAVKKVKLVPLLAIQFLTEGIIALLASLTFFNLELPRGISWLPILYLAFFATSIAWGLNSFAQRVVKSQKIVLVYILEPLIAGLLGFIIYKENLGLKEILGAIIMLFALVLPLFKNKIVNITKFLGE